MTMTPNNDQPREPNDAANQAAKNLKPSPEGEYLLSAKDAGWRRPGLFIAPAKFITLDPPVPKKRRPTPER